MAYRLAFAAGRIDVALEPDGVALELRLRRFAGESDRGVDVGVVFGPRPVAFARPVGKEHLYDDDAVEEGSPDIASLAWHMRPTPPTFAEDSRDLFAYVIDVCQLELMLLLRDGALDPLRAEREQALVRTAVRRANHYAWTLCDPDTRRLAARLHPHARYFVYRELAATRDDCLQDLVFTCPGLWLLLAGAEELAGEGTRGLAAATLGEAARGRPLKRVIDTAVEWWLALALALPTDRSPAAICALKERGHEHGFPLRYRTFVRRASRLVDPMDLAQGPAEVFAPEDIPSGPRRNAVWYRIMTMVSRRLCQGDLRTAFLRFASAQALPLARLRNPDQDEYACDYRDAFGFIWEMCERTGRRPDRRTDAAALFEEAVALERAAAVRRVPRWRRTGPFVLSLAEPPPAPISAENLTVRPLATRQALREEGTEMQHCVGGFGEALARGATTFYALQIGDERLTAMLKRRRNIWRLEQLQGRRDRKPTTAELARVERWLRDCGAQVRDGKQ